MMSYAVLGPLYSLLLPCTKMLTFYMDIYVTHLKFPFPLTFSAKTLWVPAHCKISSENFVGARAPRTRRSAPHAKYPVIPTYLAPLTERLKYKMNKTIKLKRIFINFLFASLSYFSSSFLSKSTRILSTILISSATIAILNSFSKLKGHM